MANGDFTQGSGFRICGTVVRKFVPESRKIAFLTLDVAGPRSSRKLDMRTFDRGIIDDVGALMDGALVEVTGGIDVEPVKDRSGKEVTVDGRNKWVPALTLKVLRVAPSSQQPAPRANEQPPLDDQDVPF